MRWLTLSRGTKVRQLGSTRYLVGRASQFADGIPISFAPLDFQAVAT